jgi:hypothetical protein
MTEQYISPDLTEIGTLSKLTLGASDNAGAFGKGSTSPDGKSGLTGNRSGK